MRCQELEKYAIPYVDGGLGGREHGEVEQHLRECAACAERLQGFAEVNARLGEWEEIRPSASFDARLEQRIAAQRAASRSWWERFVYGLMPFHKPVLAGGVAAMILAAVFLVQYAPIPSGQETAEPETVPAVAALSASEELALYQEMPVLENWELLSNFEVLQELRVSTP